MTTDPPRPDSRSESPFSGQPRTPASLPPIDLPDGASSVHYPVLIPNMRGLDNLLKLEESCRASRGPHRLTDEIAVFVSATEVGHLNRPCSSFRSHLTLTSRSGLFTSQQPRLCRKSPLLPSRRHRESHGKRLSRQGIRLLRDHVSVFWSDTARAGRHGRRAAARIRLLRGFPGGHDGRGGSRVLEIALEGRAGEGSADGSYRGEYRTVSHDSPRLTCDASLSQAHVSPTTLPTILALLWGGGPPPPRSATIRSQWPYHPSSPSSRSDCRPSILLWPVSADARIHQAQRAMSRPRMWSTRWRSWGTRPGSISTSWSRRVIGSARR